MGIGKPVVPDPIGNVIGWYDQHAEDLARRYEAVPADRAHARLTGLLPAAPALVFDIGAGTGRDAALLAAQGHQVVAIEPAGAMLRRGQELHPDDRIRWLESAWVWPPTCCRHTGG